MERVMVQLMRSLSTVKGNTCGALAMMVFALSGIVAAQGGDQFATSSQQIGFPSPNAASMALFSQIPVNYSTGVAEVTVPLLHVSSRHVDHTVALRYHGSGIRVSQQAGWVGLGWTLTAGGAVTRTMRGLPDEVEDGYIQQGWQTEAYASGSMDPAEQRAYLRDVAMGRIDGMPDLFQVSVDGLNLTFMMDSTQVVLMPHSNVKVKPEFDGEEIAQWTIWGEDGTKYVFAEQEWGYASTFNKTANSLGGIGPQSYVSSWYVTRIESSLDQEAITFTYASSSSPTTRTLDIYSTRTDRLAYFTCPVGQDDYVIQNSNITYNKYLSQITTPTRTIHFDVTEDSGAAMTTRLTAIRSLTNPGGELDQRYDFNYSTFGVDARRMLESVTGRGSLGAQNPGWEFTYYTDEPLPSYTSEAIDHWGYYNGATGNTVPYPAVTVTQTSTNLTGADRNPDSTVDGRYVRSGSLRTITYPQGGHTEFTYAINEYYDEPSGTNKRGPGLRIDQIKVHDGVSSANDQVWTYSYMNATLPSRSSGYLVNGPLELYSYTSSNDSFTGCPYVVRASAAQGTLTGQVLAYTWVSEHEGSGNGYTRHRMSYALDTGYNNSQYSRGRPLEQAVFHSSNDLLRETVNTYDFSLAQVGSVWGVESMVDWVTPVGSQDTTFSDKRVRFYSYFTGVTQHSTSVSEGSSTQVTTTREHMYDTDEYVLRQTTETNSSGQERTLSYEYAFERYVSMAVANQKSQVYRSSVADGSGTVSRNWTEWMNGWMGTAEDSVVWRPWRWWVWSSGTPGDDPTTATVTMIREVLDYDEYANPKEVGDGVGNTTQYEYDSSGNYLTQVTRVNPSGTDLVESAEYDGFGRIIKRVDANSNPVWFEYDGWGRLVGERDTDGSAVVSYRYYDSRRWNAGDYSTTDPNFVRTVQYPALTQPVANPGFEQYWILDVPTGWGRSGSMQTRRAEGWGSGSSLEVRSSSGTQYVQGLIGEPQNLDFSIGGYYSDQQISLMAYVPYSGYSGSAAFTITLQRIDPGDLSVKASSQSYTYTVPTSAVDQWVQIQGVVRVYSGAAWTNPAYRTYLRIAVNTSSKWVRLDEIHLQQAVGAEPYRMATTYGDGLGRPIQSQIRDGAARIVTGTSDYDARGLVYRQWKAYPLSGPQVYDGGYAAAANAYYDGSPGPNAGGRAYVQTTYESSPLRRVVRVNPEGVSGTGAGTVRTVYGTATVGSDPLVYVQTTDESGNVGRVYQDGWARTLRQIAAFGTTDAAETQMSYDVMDRVTQSTTPTGLSTTYTYNPRGLLSQRVSPDAGTETLVYDQNGRLRYRRTPNLTTLNRYQAISYDFSDRMVIERTCVGAIPTSLTAGCSTPQQALTYVFDDASVGSGVGFTVTNALGNLTKVTFPGGYYLYSYDDDGTVAAMHNKLDGMTARRLTYGWNRLGELTRRGLDTEPYVWEYTYGTTGWPDESASTTSGTAVADQSQTWWPTGLVSTRILGNQTISQGYDARDRLVSINNVASATPKFSAAYTYNANGTVQQSQFHQSSSPHSQKRYRFTYGYDGRDQLSTATYQYWTGSAWAGGAYSLATGYTDDGALTALTRYNATDNADLEYSYTAGTHRLNEVIDWYNQEIYEFTYDGNGNVNRLSSVIGSSDYQITSTSYDWRNLPLSMVVSGAGIHTWRYDHQGQRVYSSAGSTYWLRGAMGETVALYGFDGSGIELEHWNLLDAGGAVIGRREGSTRYYYHTDHLGSTRAVVDGGGTVSEVYDYMPFGELMDGRSTTADLTREKFTGQPFDPEVNLYTMHWRRYVPWFGVFTSVDALSADYPAWSPYAYALNNPVVYIDPTGEFPVCYNCDETYQIGSVVENQYGSWTYQGNNQWTNFKDNSISGMNLLASFNQVLEGGFIRQWEPSWTERWSESSNIFAGLSYSFLNSPWIAFQVLNPFDSNVTHISGALATTRERIDAGVASAPIGYSLGKISGAARVGREFTFSSKFRIAPFGNRTGHPTGRFPHYHRRGVTDSRGNPLPGEGLGRHRPWDPPAPGRPWYTRF